MEMENSEYDKGYDEGYNIGYDDGKMNVTVKQVTDLMNGYNVIEISKQGTLDTMFIGRVDEYWRYPFAVKINDMDIAQISVFENVIRIICRNN